MTYDHWKTTNPADEWLGPEPIEECFERTLEAESGRYYVEPRGRTYVLVDDLDGRDVQHFPYGKDWRVALKLAETLRDELNGGV